MKIKEMWNKVLTFGSDNSPALLAGSACVGVMVTMGMAYKAAPKAAKIMDDYHQDMSYIRSTDDWNDLAKKDQKREVIGRTVKDLTPVVLPSVLMAGVTIACIIGSQKVNAKRLALLTTAYGISENALKDLNEKMQNVLGEKKTMDVKNAVIKDKLAGSPPPTKEEAALVVPGSGNVLCKDMYTGRYFASNAQKIGAAINRVSHDLMTDMYVSLNDFYEIIGLDPCPMGNDLGWNVDDCIGGQAPITLSAVLTDNGTPCLCVDYDVALREDFRRLH